MSWHGYQITEEDHRRLHRVLVSKLSDFGIAPSDGEDLIQEVLLQAQKTLNAGGFDGLSAFDTWVVGIAKKCCLKDYRHRRAAKRRADEVALDDPQKATVQASLRAEQPTPEATAADRQQLRLLMAAIGRLPEKLRKPLIMVAAGRTYRDVAAALDISTSLVTSRVHQARAKLRREHLQSPRPPNP